MLGIIFKGEHNCGQSSDGGGVFICCGGGGPVFICCGGGGGVSISTPTKKKI